MRFTTFLLLALTISITACKKHGLQDNEKKDYSAFLAQSNRHFRGTFDGASFYWNFGFNQFQSITGYENGNGICDSTDPARVVLFGLTSEDGAQTRFRLYSPKYNSGSDEEISRVFGVGKKKLGDFRTDFSLVIIKDNMVYQSNRFNSTNEIEILQTQEFTDYRSKKMLRVWFRLDAKLNNSVLADGLMIAEFYGVKMGQ
ncbi:MAG TPA: hypothetical protein VFI06_08575 [Chitinophagaceae bacterium]|nr:hypothetical protein [Chitinophagaceae bacterium]